MIEITKDWSSFKVVKEARSLEINYAEKSDSWILLLISDPFLWCCRLNFCRDERVLIEQAIAEGATPPDPSQDLLDLEEFEERYQREALPL